MGFSRNFFLVPSYTTHRHLLTHCSIYLQSQHICELYRYRYIYTHRLYLRVDTAPLSLQPSLCMYTNGLFLFLFWFVLFIYTHSPVLRIAKCAILKWVLLGDFVLHKCTNVYEMSVLHMFMFILVCIVSSRLFAACTHLSWL